MAAAVAATVFIVCVCVCQTRGVCPYTYAPLTEYPDPPIIGTLFLPQDQQQQPDLYFSPHTLNEDCVTMKTNQFLTSLQ